MQVKIVTNDRELQDAYSIPFYAKLCYEIVSEEFLDAGIVHRTMKKYLG